MQITYIVPSFELIERQPLSVKFTTMTLLAHEHVDQMNMYSNCIIELIYLKIILQSLKTNLFFFFFFADWICGVIGRVSGAVNALK